MSDPVDVLRGLVPFSKLTDDELTKIVSELDMVQFLDGKDIFLEGDRGDAMYVILDGAIAVVKQGRTIAQLPKGTVVGEIGLLTAEHIRTATARAIGHTVLLRWQGADFNRRILEQEPLILKVALDLAHQLAERLSRISEQFIKLQNQGNERVSEFEDFRNRMLNEVLF